MAWSPSSTEEFLQCPMRWYLKRQGAVGRAMDTSAMDQGTDFHAAMAMTWQFGAPGGWPSPIEKAIALTFAQEGEALRERMIIALEQSLGGPEEERLRHGRYNGTCDLVTENATGLTVTDYKTKAKMDARFADGELRQTQRSWQLRQYAWFVQEKYSRPVTKIRKLLVAFTPVLKVWLVDYPVTQESLVQWYRQAEDVWYMMDMMAENDPELDYVPWQNPDACERYGWQYRCQFYGKCWEGEELAFYSPDGS